MDMDISMDIHAKSVDMDMDMDEKFHIHGNPGNLRIRKSWNIYKQMRISCKALLLYGVLYAASY